jgi:MoaA/NifB/PqqE/SkfB family radical SAM enzyme
LSQRIGRAHKRSIARGVFDYNVTRHFGTLPPRQLQINLTYRCNARCTMCNIWQMQERPEMTAEDFSLVLQDPLFQGIERLTLAGGEPSLRRDLVTLTELFVHGMPRLTSLTLVTNGLAVERVLADAQAMLDLCSARGIGFNVSVSLDGVGQVHDEMRNIPGAFLKVERCLIGLKDLQKSKPFWLGAACVITHKNLRGLNELQAWCAERGIDLGFQLVGFHESYVANVERRSELDFDAADRVQLLTILQGLSAGRTPSNVMSYYWNDMLRMYRDGRPRQTPCPFTLDSFALDAYGDMYYCLSERTIGNCLAAVGKAPCSSASDSSAGREVPVPTGRTPARAACSAIYYDPQNLAFRRELARTACQRCNSACFVNVGIKKDLKKYLAFLVTGK